MFVAIGLIGDCEFWGGVLVVGAPGDYGLAGRVLPLAVVVDVAVDAGGADYRRGGDADAMDVFEDGFESDAEIAAAESVEAEGASVAVESLVIVKTVFVNDGERADPVDEIVVDGIAIGMMADGALAGVALGIGRGIGMDADGCCGPSGIGRGGGGNAY